MGFLCKCLVTLTVLSVHQAASQSAFNPTILQDTRNEPKVDGTFGFLYRTEDGIAHAAKGDANGVIQGRFSYSDPTGFKLNYNYNAGTRVAPGYNYDAAPGPAPAPAPAPAPRQYEVPQYQEPAPQPQYTQTEAHFRQPSRRPLPRYRPQPQLNPEDFRPRYSAQYRESDTGYNTQTGQPGRTRPYARRNEIYDDY